MEDIPKETLLPSQKKLEKSIEPIKDLLKKKETSIGAPLQERAKWLTSLKPEELSSLLIEINQTVRNIDGSHIFDGMNVVAGQVGPSVPPDHSDKEPVLNYALTEVQAKAMIMLRDGATPQEILNMAAVVLPTIVNKLHFFADGNGRTSRILRMVLRDGAQNIETGVTTAILKQGFNRYDATPIPPIDYAISKALTESNGTQSIRIKDEFDSENDILEDVFEAVNSIPNLDKRVVKSYQDSLNFSEAMCLFIKRNNLGIKDENGIVEISLRKILFDLSTDSKKLESFLNIYREVLKERVTLMVDALTGKRDLFYVKSGRQAKNQEELGLIDVDTVQKLQTAYVEAFSPLPSA